MRFLSLYGKDNTYAAGEEHIRMFCADQNLISFYAESTSLDMTLSTASLIILKSIPGSPSNFVAAITIIQIQIIQFHVFHEFLLFCSCSILPIICTVIMRVFPPFRWITVQLSAAVAFFGCNIIF